MNSAEQMHALAIGEVMSQLRQLAKSPTPVPDQTFVLGMLEGFEKIGVFDPPHAEQHPRQGIRHHHSTR